MKPIFWVPLFPVEPLFACFSGTLMSDTLPSSSVAGVRTLNKAPDSPPETELSNARRVSLRRTADSARRKQKRQKKKKNGTRKCNFPPLLHKRSDKSSTASRHGLIGVKSFDVPNANHSKQIRVPLVQSSSSKIHPTLSLQDKCSWLSACFRRGFWFPVWGFTCETDAPPVFAHCTPVKRTDVRAVYSASLANDTSDSFSVRWEFEKCPPWVFLVVVVAVTVKQIMKQKGCRF